MIGIFGGGKGGSSIKEILGADVVVNGGFDVDASWNKGLDWTITEGVLRATGVLAGTNSNQNPGLVVGRKYRYEIEVSAYTGGTIKVYMGSGSAGMGITTSGVFKQDLVCKSNATLYVYATVGGTFDIEYIKVREINNIEEDE